MNLDSEILKAIASSASPRQYQYELFEESIKRNTIAVLETGSGKTMIAIMVMKHLIELNKTSKVTH